MNELNKYEIEITESIIKEEVISVLNIRPTYLQKHCTNYQIKQYTIMRNFIFFQFKSQGFYVRFKSFNINNHSYIQVWSINKIRYI
jgi:hypothetical protein